MTKDDAGYTKRSVSKQMWNHDNPRNVTNMQKKFRDSFANGATLDASKWKVQQTGAGMTVAQANGELNITTGIIANAETIIISREAFTVPFRALFAPKITQRIANQEFYVEMVSVDEVTGLPNSKNMVAGWKFDGTVATTGVYEVGQYALAKTTAAATILTTAAYSIKEIEITPDEVWWHEQTIDTVSARQNQWRRNSIIPDPNELYVLRIRVKNLAVAPASSTIFSLQFASVVDYSELPVEITGSRGSQNGGVALPVVVAGGSMTTYDLARGLQFQESITALGAGANIAGTSRDGGTAVQYATFAAAVATDQPGTLSIQGSTDGTNFKTIKSVAVLANDGATLEVPNVFRYHKARYVNGPTAQTAFHLQDGYIS